MSFYGQPERSAEYWAELRRKANANLADPHRTVKSSAAKDRRTELEKALPYEIELGHMILEERELRKLELRYARREDKLSADERAAWEEVDARLDTLREELKGTGQDERRRCVRLWNKSRKARYKL